MPRLSPGDTVDRYVVERLLGEGGMATVYLVRHAHLGSWHALKVLGEELLDHAELRDRFLAEGRIQAQMAHPHIARVTDIVAQEGLAALVMEYVPGPTLDEFIAQRWERGAEPMPVEQIAAVMLPICEAVAAAHARGVLHRDLKPANLIVGTTESGALRPVVLDFGVARIQEASSVVHRRRAATRIGASIGTPAYMSPEQARGQLDLDARTDVFALGAILYELATGSSAFAGENEFDTLSNVVSGRFVGAGAGRAGELRGALGAVVQRALEVERDRRFGSVIELRDALVVACSPVLDRTPTSQLDSVSSLVSVADGADDGGWDRGDGADDGGWDRADGADDGGWDRADEAGDGGWVREGESGGLEPPMAAVPPPGASGTVPPPLRRGRWGRRIKWFLLLLVLAVGTALAAPIVEQELVARRRLNAEGRSRALARSALATLELRQTDAQANADPSTLDRALDDAQTAVWVASLPEARAAFALALVLHGGWHLARKGWSESEFGAVDAATRAASGPTASLEGRLARVIVTARACRVLPAHDARRPGFCVEAQDGFADLRRRVRGDPRAWIRVEVGWMASGFLDALSNRADEGKDKRSARTLAAEAAAACTEVLDAHGRGSVNDAVLRGVCLTASGRAATYGDYYRWARLIRADDEAGDGKLQSKNVELIYSMAGPAACRDLRFDKRNDWKRTLPGGKGAEVLFCTVVGLYALDCPLEAAGLSVRGAAAGLVGANDERWSAPTVGWHREGERACYLRANVGD